MPLPLRLRPVLSALAPSACWCCGAAAPAAEPLCRACRARLRFLGPRVTPLSGVPLWAAVAYEGPARSLIHGLKYRGAAGLAEPLAAQMAANMPRSLLVPARMLVPVPAAAARRRRRGYDQAAMLAVALSSRMDVPVDLCLRRREGASQVGRSRGARLRALESSIHVRSAPPPAVLLVDDVATTGATLAACAAALRDAGCESIAAVTYARTPGR